MEKDSLLYETWSYVEVTPVIEHFFPSGDPSASVYHVFLLDSHSYDDLFAVLWVHHSAPTSYFKAE